ncbi:MAG: glycoside hydrolase family 3 protein, partial [Phycisphaerae bacterium]|nr:glycoside hydrolase family 3 protein [Phycisphaerae bacterium]
MKASDLSLEQKIAQMMVYAYRDPDQILALVRAGAGGVWPCRVPRDSVEEFRAILRDLQAQAPIPLFISTDFESGVGQLITGEQCTEFPGMMAFGAIAASNLKRAEELAYRAGCVVAEEADYLGINITPSPVFDVNTVPENPICNTRSVGDNPRHVSAVAVAYARGMMSKGRLLPQAKHFPGEGMHKLDPHLGLEVMDVSRDAMERIHLPPFAAAVTAGIPMMMTNHAVYPPYDPEFPCTLSHALITGLLRETLGFDGLVITDAMEMHGITERYSPREALTRAVLAGNDLILGPAQPDQAVAELSRAVRDGDVPEAVIDTAVNRILKHKQAMGLTPGTIPENPLPTTPPEERRMLSETIAREALTLIANRGGTVPVTPNPDARVLVLEPEHPNHPL